MKVRSTRFLIALLLPASLAFGQAIPESSTENIYGIADEAVLVLDAWAFEPAGAGATWEWTSSGRYLTSGASSWSAPFQLPPGAIITTVELEGCDFFAASELSVRLMRRLPGSFGGGFGTLQEIGFLSSSGSDGCGRWSGPVSSAVGAVDNAAYSYYVDVAQGVFSGSHRLAAVRIYYVLQVSPAPETATFADVPVGSALHQYVEALAAAGITGGCGGGNFCPNSPVTRGQIAVFLAKALGLHWAP